MADVLDAPESYVEVPEYLWYGEEYVKLTAAINVSSFTSLGAHF
jgi:hypothetical protein